MQILTTSKTKQVKPPAVLQTETLRDKVVILTSVTDAEYFREY